MECRLRVNPSSLEVLLEDAAKGVRVFVCRTEEKGRTEDPS